MMQVNNINANNIGVNSIGVNSINAILRQEKPSSLVDLFDFRGRSNLDADRKQVVGKKGNVLTLNNFSFSKMSGYGGFHHNFENYTNSGFVGATYDSLMYIAFIQNPSYAESYEYISVPPGETYISKSFTFTVNDLPQEGSRRMIVFSCGKEKSSHDFEVGIRENGTVTVPEFTLVNNTSETMYYFYKYQFLFFDAGFQDPNPTIHQSPLYPDSLVFDGVDDWAQVIDGDVWGKTVIMRCTPLKLENVLYDQRKQKTLANPFAIYGEDSYTYAYQSRNVGGTTYIDGELNTTRYPSDLLNVDQVITITNDNSIELNGSNFILGCSQFKTIFASMAVKYLAIYKEVLTPEQIREEIDKLEGDLIEPYARYDLKEQGATNESMKLNPILRNLQGNPDYDIKLRNFLWALNSGVGKYDTDFKVGWDLAGSYGEIASPTKVEANVSSSVPSGSYIVRCKSLDSIRSDSFKIRVKGISDTNYSLNIGFSDSLLSVCNTDGIHTINKNEIPVSTQSGYFGFKLRPFTIMKEFKIEIELIPENPDGLYFDGVDDFGLGERFPILTDYTVMAKREYQSENIIDSCFLSKRARDSADDSGAFQIERIGGRNDPLTFSFGIINPIKLPINTKDVICQTRNSYNGNNIKYGSAQDTNTLTVGKFNPTSSHYTKVVFYNAVFWDRTLTDYELKRAKRKYFKTE